MKRISLVLCLGLALPAAAVAQTAYPMITHAYPPAVQRGKTVEVVVQGQQSFAGAYEALFEGTGITAEVLGQTPPGQKPDPRMRPTPANTVRLKVTVAADAPVGVREFRVATTRSLSSVGQLVVVDQPVIVESAANNTAETAGALPVPGVACGRIEAAEDADFFKFTAVSAQTLTFEVLGARLQDKIHDLQLHADPVLFLFDAQGRELASNDDYRFADPLLTYRFEKAGEYFLQIRDAKYTGDARWVYVLKVHDRPQAAHVFPLAVAPGQTAKVQRIDAHLGDLEQADVSMPRDAEGLTTLPLQSAESGVEPVTVLATSLPLVNEQEPNDTPRHAGRISIPCCINGRIGARSDLDHFAFEGKRGRPIRFEVYARRFGTELHSLLDSSLDILDEQGRVLVGADDASPAVKDSVLVFNPPRDGTFNVRLRDLHNKGGAQYVYALEVRPVEQDFTVRVDGDKAMLGPGARMPWYVIVQRTGGFTGPIQIEVEGLPEGVTASPLVIAPEMTQGLLVLSAAKEAKLGVSKVRVLATAELTVDGKKQRVTKLAATEQEIYFPGGGRGRFEVNLPAVAVTESADVPLVEVSPKTVEIKPGQEVRIDVKLTRNPQAANANVTLDVRLRHLGGIFGNPLPQGVLVVENKSKTLLGKANQGYITLRATPDAAPVSQVPISVVASVSINFVVKIGYSSPPISLTVTGK